MFDGYFSDPAKLEAVEQLNLLAEDAGIPMVHLALAFVMQHPVSPPRSSGPAR